MASIKKNIFYNILLTTSQVAFSLISLPYITRVLGPLQLGRVSFVDSATQYFVITASLGIPIYGIRAIATVKQDKLLIKKTFTELLLIQLITSAFLLLVYYLVIVFVHEFNVEQKLFNLGLIQLLLSSFITDWFFQGMENYGLISIRAFMLRLISITAILLFVKSQQDVYLYYAIWTSTSVINVLLSVYYTHSYISFKNLDLKKHIKPILTFFSTKFITNVYVVLLSVFIGYLENKVFVAYFTSAFKIYTVCITFILAFTAVLIPKLSAYFKNNMHSEGAILLSKNLNVVINYSLPLVAVTIFFSLPIVKLLLGDPFLPARTDLMLLAPLILIISISNVFSLNVLTPMGKEGLFLKATVIGMIFNLSVVFILIPMLKDVGAAIALLLTECIVCGCLWYYSYRQLKGITINYRVAAGNFSNCIFSFGVLNFLLVNYLLQGTLYFTFLTSVSCCSLVFLLIELFVVKDPYFLELWTAAVTTYNKIAAPKSNK